MPDKLNVPAGYRLKTTALSHGWHECPPLSWADCGESLQMVLRGAGRTAYRFAVVSHAATTADDRRKTAKSTSRAKRAGQGRATALRVACLDHDGPPIADFEPAIRRVLNADHDLSSFYDRCADHAALRIVPKIGAGRLLRGASLFEDAVKTLCATNVNWSQAVRMIHRLGQLGPEVENFRHLNAFPSPREILKAGESYLTGVCRLGYRAAHLLAYCRGVQSGELDLDAIERAADDAGVSSDDLARELTAIPGIGPASANFLLNLLGRHDRLAIDSWTRTFIAGQYFNGGEPTDAEMRDIYEPFAPYQHLAFWCEQWLTWGTAKQIIAARER